MPFNADIQNDFYAEASMLHGALLLSPCSLTLRRSRSTKEFDVYDSLRDAWVALTPEEWVRQHFVNHMVTVLGFSPMRIANEVSLKLNGNSRRADTVVYDDFLKPVLVVEYKAPNISLTRKVLEQALLYNLTINAKAIMITNGKDVYSVVGEKMWRGVVTPNMLVEQ